MKVGIIGAGPAGISCALALANAGARVTIFEELPQVGGMCRSFDLWNMRVDLGPHRFFSMDRRVTDFWLGPLRDDFVLVDRLTRIFYENKFFSYPIKPLDALAKLGLAESIHCSASYLAAVMAPKSDEKSFAQWVSRRFGKRLFEIFFKSYSEKLWGISCDELDASFAAQRIKGLNLYEAVKNAIIVKRTRHKTLIEQFAYPAMGAGQPYDLMIEKFRNLGGSLRCNTHVARIEAKEGKATGIALAGGGEEFDHVVSTMPFTDAVENCDAFDENAKKAASQLKYRNTTLVYLLINKNSIFRDNWIYVHAPSLKTGRITNFRNWSQTMLRGSDKSVLALEYWSDDNDRLWLATDAELEDTAAREMAETGLVKREDIEDARVVRLHRSYPVYARGYEKHLRQMQAAADAIEGLTCIGRNGAFKYNNQDHSILMGLMAADNILGKAQHNLWRINTDYDYQEGESAIHKNDS